jgi:SAM-dependent methyltransferase
VNLGNLLPEIKLSEENSLPKLYLPDRQHICQIGDDDPLKYYYLPLTSCVYRKRLQMAMVLLGEKRFGHLLEVGYGSGIFLPTLARRCDKLSGVDIHTKVEQVQQMLAAERISATLQRGNVLNLPYRGEEFDAVVCLSVLEHLRELDVAVDEICRVAKSGATVVLGFPVRNVATSSFYRLMGYDHMEIHPSSHRDILSAVQRRLTHLDTVHFPPLLPLDLSLYIACRGIKDK